MKDAYIFGIFAEIFGKYWDWIGVFVFVQKLGDFLKKYRERELEFIH